MEVLGYLAILLDFLEGGEIVVEGESLGLGLLVMVVFFELVEGFVDEEWVLLNEK